MNMRLAPQSEGGSMRSHSDGSGTLRGKRRVAMAKPLRRFEVVTDPVKMEELRAEARKSEVRNSDARMYDASGNHLACRHYGARRLRK